MCWREPFTRSYCYYTGQYQQIRGTRAQLKGPIPGMKIALTQLPNAICFPAGPPIITELYLLSLQSYITLKGADMLESIILQSL